MYYDSSLVCYDKLIGCQYDDTTWGVPSGIIVVDAGATTVGKTILNIQKAFSVMKQNKSNCLYIDTEGGAKEIILGWKPVFEKRFDIQTNFTEAKYRVDIVSRGWRLSNHIQNLPNIILITVRDLFNLYELHGSPIKLRLGEGGKIDIIKKPFLEETEELPIEKTPIGSLVKEFNVKLVIYDSLIELFKQRIPATRENFPARANLLHMLMGCLQRLAETYNIPVIGITHTSIDPANPYAKESPSAINVISYNTKIITLVQNPYSKAEKAGLRKITIWRHPTKAPFSETYQIKLTNEGFVDVGEEKQ